MEGKKISFGFMKTKKAEKPVVAETKDFIECLEEKAIKVVGGTPIEEEKPLVIPMQPNTLITTEKLKQIAAQVERGLEELDPVEEPHNNIEEKPPENETLDQMAVRELLQDAKKEVKVETQILTVPLPAEPVLDGKKESSLEDYEAVPIQQFGMAMLRGMGWTANNQKSSYKQPQLRPKGLGLGAEKVVSDNQKKKSKDAKGEELTIVKNAFVKIATGKYSGYYGKVVSLDEDNGRVMVDITVKKETVSLSEFMMQPVTKAEYDKECNVINADSYEEYKKRERDPQKSSKNATKSSEQNNDSLRKSNDVKDSRSSKKEDRTDNYNERSSREEKRESSNGKSKVHSRHQRDSSSEDRSRRRKKKNKKKYSDSETSDSEIEQERTDKDKKNIRDSSDSDSDGYKKSRRDRTPGGKRDIDKKRKGKKKKRDRDRSPNYKKHRK